MWKAKCPSLSKTPQTICSNQFGNALKLAAAAAAKKKKKTTDTLFKSI